MYQNIIQKSTKYLIYAILALSFLIGLGIGLLIDNSKPSKIIIDKNIKIGLPAQTGLDSDNSQVINANNYKILGNFLASINSKIYYPKDCTAAKRIKEENRIWFNAKEEAEAQGYKPAQNCGL